MFHRINRDRGSRWSQLSISCIGPHLVHLIFQPCDIISYAADLSCVEMGKGPFLDVEA